MKGLFLVLSALLIGAHSYAASGSLKANITSLNLTAIYTANGNEYNQTGATGTIVTKIKGSGALEQMNDVSQQDASSTLSDPSKGEFVKVVLERTGDKLGNIHMQMLKNSELGDFTTSSTTEFELINGTWADFDAGKDVQVRSTKKGIKQEREFQKQMGNQIAGMLSTALKAQGAVVSNIDIDVNTSENDIVTISKTQIVSPQALVEIKISLYVRIN